MTHCRPDEGQGKGRQREEGEGGEGKAEGGGRGRGRRREGIGDMMREGSGKNGYYLGERRKGLRGGVYLHYQHMLQIGHHTEQMCPHQMASVALQMGR